MVDKEQIDPWPFPAKVVHQSEPSVSRLNLQSAGCRSFLVTECFFCEKHESLSLKDSSRFSALKPPPLPLIIFLICPPFLLLMAKCWLWFYGRKHLPHIPLYCFLLKHWNHLNSAVITGVCLRPTRRKIGFLVFLAWSCDRFLTMKDTYKEN